MTCSATSRTSCSRQPPLTFPVVCRPRRRAASRPRAGTPSRGRGPPSRARRADRSDAAPPDGRALLGSRAIASSFTYAIPAGTTGATDPRLGGLLLPGHRGRREPRPRQGWQAEVLAGAVQGVVDVAVDVLLAELVVQPRALERDHGLGVHVRKQHQRALAAASLYQLA